MSAFLMVELTMRSVESFRSSLAFMASLTALLMSSRSMVASLKMGAPEGPWSIGRFRVYIGAVRATPLGGPQTDRPGCEWGHRPWTWLSQDGPIRVDLAEKRGTRGSGCQICGKRM